MSSRTIRLPGPDGPEITIDRPLIGRPRVSVGGHLIDRVAGSKTEYAVPMPDGTSRTIRVSGGTTGLSVIDADGSTLEIDRSLRPWEIVLAFAPIALVVTGGLIGGLLGGLAAGVNLIVVRSGLATAARAGAMVAVTAVAVVAWFGIATFIGSRLAEVPRVATGDCLKGVGPSIALTTENAKPVDCALGHAGEVVGLSQVTGPDGSAYPGEAALETAAVAACPGLFESYVGIAFGASRLDMYYVAPSSDTWGRDDRTVVCIAVDPGGGVLTGSVRAIAR